MRTAWIASLTLTTLGAFGLLATLASAEPIKAPGAASAPAGLGAAVTESATPVDCSTNPNALGVSRVVEIDAAGGPGYGFQQYRQNDFLGDHEVVLTFDDGPMPAYTMPILKALDAHCTKVTFFIVGKMALAYPETVKEEARRGHTIGTHTWSHSNLHGSRRRSQPHASVSAAGPSLRYQGAQKASFPAFDAPRSAFMPTPADKAEREIELGFSAVQRALGAPIAPFFRFPYLADSRPMLNHLHQRNVAVFSIDVDSVDYRAKRPEDVMRRVFTDLEQQRKGIILFHDIQRATALALPAVLAELQARGYKVVHLKPKVPLQTLAAYDAAAEQQRKATSAADKKPLSRRALTWSMLPPGSPRNRGDDDEPEPLRGRAGDVPASASRDTALDASDWQTAVRRR